MYMLFFFRLQERAGNVRRSLRDLELSEEKFYELRTTTDDDLSLRDYVAVCFRFLNSISYFILY